MLKVSDAVNLAFHAMLLLAAHRDEQQLSVQFLAKRMGVSDNHLSKVMQRLAKAGMVASKRGPKGGFSMGKPAKDIRLIDIFEVIEGKQPARTCLLDHPVCDGRCCLLGGLLVSLQGQINDHLTRTTLADVSEDLPGLSMAPGKMMS